MLNVEPMVLAIHEDSIRRDIRPEVFATSTIVKRLSRCLIDDNIRSNNEITWQKLVLELES